MADYIKEIISAFRKAVKEIESLKDYYYQSNNALIEYRLKTEQNYAVGKRIADLFDSLFEIKDITERNLRIPDIGKTMITESFTVSDVVEIAPAEKDEENYIRFFIKNQFLGNDCFNPQIAIRKYEQLERYEFILIESILSHIVVAYELFLSEIFKSLIVLEPVKYIKNQTIPLADVFSKSFHDSLIEKLDSLVDSTMRDSIAALDMIAKEESISFGNYQDVIDAFKEIYYRRNAYVHTNGRVNRDYLKKVKKEFTADVHEGDKLVCDDIYLKNAIQTLSKIVFAFTFELLKKGKADDKTIDVLGRYYFEKISDEEFELAQYVYFRLSGYMNLEFRSRLVYRINYIIASKQLGDQKTVQRELQKLDVSAADDSFKIAKYCLNEEFEKAFYLLSETYPKTFDAVSVREWPLFIDFRNTEYYQKFIDLHKDDFDVQEIGMGKAYLEDETEKAEEEKREG